MNHALKKAASVFGKTLLWFSWVYPFLRVFIILPIAAVEESVGEEKTKMLLTIAKYLHGGQSVSDIVAGPYMVYFVLSVVAFIAYRVRKKIRIGWGQRIALALVTVYNFFNIYLMHLVASDAALN